MNSMPVIWWHTLIEIEKGDATRSTLSERLLVTKSRVDSLVQAIKGRKLITARKIGKSPSQYYVSQKGKRLLAEYKKAGTLMCREKFHSSKFRETS